MAKSKNNLMEALTEILDPELNISIVDLGLVYKAGIDKKKNVNITMTLTTLGCPLFSVIEKEIEQKLKPLGYNNIKVTLTFDPPWSMEKMSERAKAMLGL